MSICDRIGIQAAVIDKSDPDDDEIVRRDYAPIKKAGDEVRTRDPDLGKVVLYQLSYSRISNAIIAN